MLLAIAIAPAQAHKPITSKYTYNADVYPIFRDRCGSCHAAGGVAPMSLLNYQGAVPWAESIREELLDERMPPWYVDQDGAAPVKDARAISPKEIDTIVTWATGGTPEGGAAGRPAPAVARQSEWPGGMPDVEIAMAEYSVPADQMESTREVVLSTGFTSARWVALADLRPGAPDLVRDATIAIEQGPLLAVWTPGDHPQRTPAGTAFQVPAGARLVVRLHYKKPWEDERKVRSDRSRVGLYFAAPDPATHPVQTLSIDSPAHEPSAPAPGLAAAKATDITASVPGAARLVAIRPQLDQPYAELDVQAVLASGVRVPLLRLHRPRPEWNRRYWLDAPIDLPAGSRVDVRAVPAPVDPDEPARPRTGTLQIALEYVGR